MRRYVGCVHQGLVDQPVVIVAVHRGPVDEAVILREDQAIGALQPDDVVEVAPMIEEEDGVARWSWVTSDARPSELADWPSS